jgi:hypothetical protein
VKQVENVKLSGDTIKECILGIKELYPELKIKNKKSNLVLKPFPNCLKYPSNGKALAIRKKVTKITKVTPFFH